MGIQFGYALSTGGDTWPNVVSAFVIPIVTAVIATVITNSLARQ